MRGILVLLAVAVGMAVASPAAAPQKNDAQGTRTVEGVVTDAGSQPVQSAVVQIKDTKTLQIRSFITQSDGAYHFAGLSSNSEYELRAEHSGSASGTKTLSVFDSRKTSVINLKLK